MARSSICVRAAASAAGVAVPKTLKPLNITKRTLIDSNGGRAVRNIDGEVYEVLHDSATDSVQVICKSARLSYATEVGRDSRIAIVLESAQPIAGGPPSLEQLQAILKGDGPGPEAINGRLAMLALPLAAALEVAGSGTLVEQAGTPAGAAGAAALALAVAVASLAPALAGKVPAARVFPSVNDAYPTQQLPYFWTALAETINGRVAMAGLAGLIVNELIRGAPVFSF